MSPRDRHREFLKALLQRHRAVVANLEATLALIESGVDEEIRALVAEKFPRSNAPSIRRVQ